MFKFIGKLFGGDSARSWTAEQHGALIDAMTFAMLIDRRVAAQEQDALHAQLSRYPWSGPMPLEHHINEGIRRARNVFESDSGHARYLADIAARLGTDALRQEAFQLCVDLAKVDGDFADSERALLEEMGEAFGLRPDDIHAKL